MRIKSVQCMQRDGTTWKRIYAARTLLEMKVRDRASLPAKLDPSKTHNLFFTNGLLYDNANVA
jgi:hypothetical protein